MDAGDPRAARTNRALWDFSTQTSCNCFQFWFQTCPNPVVPARGASGGEYCGNAARDVFGDWQFGLHAVSLSFVILFFCTKLLVALALADSVSLSN